MNKEDQLTVVVVGGGAAGFFGSVTCAKAFPQHQVILLEKSNQLLSKVRISGGGRCNVTHACFDPQLLTRFYPRGNKALKGPFTRFQPTDTIHWFESRGVQLKTEEDGRMFPITDSSETIIQCLHQEAIKTGVDIRLMSGIKQIIKTDEGYDLFLSNDQKLSCERLLIATGSVPKTFAIIEALGHQIVPLVPSLFTFNIPDSPLEDLAGISVTAKVKVKEINQEQSGPLLITHWGLSGPAVLKLSAWGARELHKLGYQATVLINWLPEYTEPELRCKLLSIKTDQAGRQIGSDSPLNLPKQLWKRLIQLALIDPQLRWSYLSTKQINCLLEKLNACSFSIKGKTTYKQEFVTCGGVSLNDVNFKTMESRRCPHLYFAGEVLDIDGVTGGFNFQNAWTTGWIAGQSMGII